MLSQKRRSTRCRVLIVEDDAVSCRAMRALLTRWSYEVGSCSTTAEAIELIARTLPNCLILDLMLPDVNGIEVLRAIRRRELPIRVAVVTAHQDPQLMRDVRELRPDVVLRKPIELSELRRWLDSVERD